MSNEILEGTRGSDVLYGNDADNPLILGRGGDDTIYGLAGDDVLSGDKGSDSLFGGPGTDLLNAIDNARDLRLDCMKGPLRRDAIDPPGDPGPLPFSPGTGSAGLQPSGERFELGGGDLVRQRVAEAGQVLLTCGSCAATASGSTARSSPS